MSTYCVENQWLYAPWKNIISLSSLSFFFNVWHLKKVRDKENPSILSKEQDVNEWKNMLERLMICEWIGTIYLLLIIFGCIILLRRWIVVISENRLKKKKKPTLKSCCCLDKFNFKIDKKKKPTLINVTVVCLDKSNFFVLLLCNRILKSWMKTIWFPYATSNPFYMYY